MTSGDRALQVHLPLETSSQAISGPRHELAELCLKQVARLDSEAYKDMLALIDVAYAHRSRIVAINVRADQPDVPDGAALMTWAELGRRRGWQRLNIKDRRDRLGESIDLLMSVRFTFDLNDPQGRRVSNVPLFYRAGIIEQDRNRLGVVLGFNELLWASMMEQQRATIYDRAIQAATAQQDWQLRLYMRLFTHLSRSWVTQGLGRRGGRLEMRLESLLDGADLDYENQLRLKGPGWLRSRMTSVLDSLTAATWDGRALLARYTYTAASDVLHDRVTIWPPVAIVEALNGHRSKSLQARGSQRQRRIAYLR